MGVFLTNLVAYRYSLIEKFEQLIWKMEKQSLRIPNSWSGLVSKEEFRPGSFWCMFRMGSIRTGLNNQKFWIELIQKITYILKLATFLDDGEQ